MACTPSVALIEKAQRTALFLNWGQCGLAAPISQLRLIDDLDA